nr:tetratricopeptide repeat-containing sulfotransferase family protein [Altererythrobacter sp. KTW20L]
MNSRPPASGQRDIAAALRLLQQLSPAMARRDRGRQVAIMRELVALNAPLGPQWQQLAQIALSLGEVDLACQIAEIHLAHTGGEPLAHCLKAAVLEQAGRLVEARAAMALVPRHIPSPAAHAFGLGTSALHLGRADEAREHLAEAARLDPGNGFAWLSLGMVSNLAGDPALTRSMLAAAPHAARAAPVPQAAYRYALGNLFDAQGDHHQAFASYASGAAIMRRVEPFNRAADAQSAAAAVTGLTRAELTRETLAAAGRQAAELPNRTLFVTGLPRSGTTLVEQILASHSKVAGGGELSLLPLLAQEACSSAGAADAATLAGLWDHLLGQRFPAPGLVVDKSLNTSRFLGLAASIAPGAPVIWVQRDPLDCAWSCFRTFFPQSMPWTYDMADIAWLFRQEEQLLARWQDLLGDRLLVVPYEQLAGDPAPWIGRILDHCGLAAEPQVFTPHHTRRAVTTASASQVRQPINRRGIGSAGPYRQYLQGFTAAPV